MERWNAEWNNSECITVAADSHTGLQAIKYWTVGRQVLVFSENVEEHIGHLLQVFSHLCEVGLKLYPQKCVLGCLRRVT